MALPNYQASSILCLVSIITYLTSILSDIIELLFICSTYQLIYDFLNEWTHIAVKLFIIRINSVTESVKWNHKLYYKYKGAHELSDDFAYLHNSQFMRFT